MAAPVPVPQSKEPRNRLTRVSPVTPFTRTSANMAPKECMDQCMISSGEAASASLSSSVTAREKLSRQSGISVTQAHASPGQAEPLCSNLGLRSQLGLGCCTECCCGGHLASQGGQRMPGNRGITDPRADQQASVLTFFDQGRQPCHVHQRCGALECFSHARFRSPRRLPSKSGRACSPHWKPSCSMNACCSGCSACSEASPSMVVIERP
jgi:hypothetical protein